MTDTIDRVQVPSEGLTLSRFLWSLDQSPTAGRIERVLELNPGLGASVYLPHGEVILIPRVSEVVSDEVQVISLWD